MTYQKRYELKRRLLYCLWGIHDCLKDVQASEVDGSLHQFNDCLWCPYRKCVLAHKCRESTYEERMAAAS